MLNFTYNLTKCHKEFVYLQCQIIIAETMNINDFLNPDFWQMLVFTAFVSVILASVIYAEWDIVIIPGKEYPPLWKKLLWCSLIAVGAFILILLFAFFGRCLALWSAEHSPSWHTYDQAITNIIC